MIRILVFLPPFRHGRDCRFRGGFALQDPHAKLTSIAIPVVRSRYKTMKQAVYIVASAVLSALVHLLVFSLSDRLTFDAFTRVELAESRRQQRVKLHPIDLREWQARNRRSEDDDEEEATAKLRNAIRQSRDLRDVFEEADLSKQPLPKLEIKGIGGNVNAPPAPEPAPQREATAPLPSIISIDTAELPGNRLAMDRPFTP